MDYTTVVLMAVGLSMDCFAVSVANAACLGRIDLPKFLLVACSFGLFQGLMPLIGYAVGYNFAGMIAEYDHWIALGILSIIGIKMIIDDIGGKKPDEDGICKEKNHYALPVVLLLSVATSIDALATGLVFITCGEWIARAVLIIGATSFVFSMAGSFLGAYCGNKVKFRFGILGGVILIAIGIKILVEHICV